MSRLQPATMRAVQLSIIGLLIGGGSPAAQERRASELSYVFEVAGDQLVEFTVSGYVENFEQRAREMARCIANMPESHRRHIVPIYIVPELPGGRASGGAGWYPREGQGNGTMRVWLSETAQARTGVPASVISEDLSRDIPGIIGIKHRRFDRQASAEAGDQYPIYDLSIIHEIGHSLQTAIGPLVDRHSVTESQLAQTRRPLAEAEADAYARFITRPNRICRRSALDGESMASCSARVAGLLRASMAFSNVPEDWNPRSNCINNTQLDAADAVSQEIGEDTGEDAVESRAPNPTSVNSAGDLARRALPVGIGVFLQRVHHPNNAFGTPAEFAANLRDGNVTWLAIPANQEGWLDEFENYLDEWRENAQFSQLFVWTGGPETSEDPESQVDRLVRVASRLDASGIILDPERAFNGERGRPAAEALMDEARRRADEVGLSIGVTTLANARIPLDAFAHADFGMPQIYDRSDSLPAAYPRERVAAWRQTFEHVYPVLGAHHRDECPRNQRCPIRPKTDDEISQLMAETPFDDGIVGWWRYAYLQSGNHWRNIAGAELGGRQHSSEGDQTQDGDPNDSEPIAPVADNAEHDPGDSGNGASIFEGPLYPIGWDGRYLVFNRALFGLSEAYNLLFGHRYHPTNEELLIPRDAYLPDGLTMLFSRIEFPAYTSRYDPRGFVAQLTEEARRMLDTLPDITDQDRIERDTQPDWVSASAWRNMLRRLDANRRGVRVYPGASPGGTDIVSTVTDEGLGFYAEMIEDETVLRQRLDLVEPSIWEQVTGRSTTEAWLDWTLSANRDYNHFMMSQLRLGHSVRDARRRYAEHARHRLAMTVLRSLQIAGGGDAAPAAQAIAGGANLAWQIYNGGAVQD